MMHEVVLGIMAKVESVNTHPLQQLFEAIAQRKWQL